jgi:ATP-dependent Clp protease ATP-binding subunit ClpA
MPTGQTQQVTSALVEAYGIATEKRNEFLTPEHLLAGFLKDKDFWEAVSRCGRAQELEENIYGYLNDLATVPEGLDLGIEFSEQLQELFDTAGNTAASAMAGSVQLHHVIYSYFRLEESFARYYLEKCLDCSVPEFLNSLIAVSGTDAAQTSEEKLSRYFRPVESLEGLVGRREELSKIIRILCRQQKNNALLAGGRGVGKTAVVRGLAWLLETGEVPAKLKDSILIELNISALLSGTQYRGDLEGRVQEIMEAVRSEGDMIVYVSELRSLGGSGKMDDGAKDILNLLTPYFKSGDIKFIISATPEEIKKSSTNDSGVLALFRQVDIDEPTDEEAEEILKRIADDLSAYHGTSYESDTISYAIKGSRRYILDRCLPDKAIDLLDEAGAYAETNGEASVTRKTVDMALADICRTDVQAGDDETKDDLYHMEERLAQRIYGQKQAIKAVSEAILMSKAGLLDSGKTVGNFLFVGPTGVGKTELSKVLAQQLHVPLHRFDMSEYSEKHSVAKLIGSPAGYVGYDDGGILTDTIRRNPYCVLLLDEIEKAHEDIYNLLLQIMDYAVITDNKGRKVDFRNVVLIMTSNAGARYAHKASIGYSAKANAGAAMAKEVKSVFAPEFINRLTSVVVFNDMDRTMAGLILDDKIRTLQTRLDARSIKLEITPEAYAKLLDEGFTQEYGAREIERVLNARITPLLMREILFGRKEGFTAVITPTEEGYALS